MNGKQCWTKAGVTPSQGTEQCGGQGISSPWNEDVLPVTGCSVTPSGSGYKPITVRVWTSLDARDAKDESFGIANVVIHNVKSSTFYCPNMTSCIEFLILGMYEFALKYTWH